VVFFAPVQNSEPTAPEGLQSKAGLTQRCKSACARFDDRDLRFRSGPESEWNNDSLSETKDPSEFAGGGTGAESTTSALKKGVCDAQ